MNGDGKDLEWYREDDDVFDDVFPGLDEGRRLEDELRLEDKLQDKLRLEDELRLEDKLRLEDELRLDEDIWLDDEDASNEDELRLDEDLWEDDMADEEIPIRFRYLKRLTQLSPEVELPQAGLEGEIEAGIYVLKDCLEELEGCARLGLSPGQGGRHLEVIQDVVVYANRQAALIGRLLG